MYRNSGGVRESHGLRRSLAGALLLGVSFGLVPCMNAADGIWIQPASGNLWGNSANWQDGTIADGANFFANFTNDITGDITVGLDAPRTIGNLVFGDSSIGTPGGWILDNNGSITNVLTLAGTTPTITVNALASGRVATISLALAGNSGLRKDGLGTLVLSGSNTYTGATVVTGGILRLTNGSALGGSATVTMSSPAQLELSGGLTFGSGSTITINGSGGANFAGSLQSASGVNAWAGNVVIGSSGSRLGAQTGATLDISGVISSAVGFNLTVRNADQTGTTILSGANTYNGSTTVLGRLSVAQIGSLGSLSSNLGAPTTAGNAQINLGLGENTATLIYTGSGESTDRVLRIASTNTSGAAIDQSGTGLLRFTSNLSQDATAVGTRTMTLTGSSAGTGEFAGGIADANAGTGRFTSLTKAGTGTWTLSGANTYSGVTTLNGGTLQVTTLANINTNSSIGRGSAAGSAADWVFGGGTLLYNTTAPASTNRLFTLGNANGLTATINSSAAASADFLSLTGPGNIAFGGSGARALTLTGSNLGNNTFAPLLGDGAGGATSLLKSGSGLWILTGANSYSGTTTIGNGGGVNAGTLRLSGSGTVGSGAVTVFGGTLDLNGTTQTIPSLALGGGASGSTATVTIGSGDLRLGGNVTFNNANNPNGALISSTTGFFSLLGDRIFTVGDSTAAAQDLTVSAIIRDGDGTPRVLTKRGSGALYLSGTNIYTGGTVVSQGNSTQGLVLLANGALGTGPLTIGDGSTDGAGARFSLNGFSQTVSALSTGATGATKVIQAGGSTGGVLSVLTVDQSIDTSYGNNGFIRDHSGASGQLAIIKTGVGFLDFSGANATQNYSGGLTVNQGTLGFAAAANLGTGMITLGGGTLRYTPIGTTSISVPNASIVLTNATNSSIEITDAGGTVTASGAVSGGGSLNKTGAGRLTLSSGSSSYSGGTTLSGGILSFSNVAALGSGAVTFAADATLEAGVGGTLANNMVIESAVTGTFNTQGNSVVASGMVSGDGVLNKEGSGLLTLSNGGNDYTGGTTINAGTLRYSQLGALGTGAVSFTADATLESGIAGILANDIVIGSGVIGTINTALIVTFSGEITGGGQILKRGAGRLNLSHANNSFSGGLVIENASTVDGLGSYGVVLLADNAAGTGPLTIGNANTSAARFSLNGYDQTVSALSSGSEGIRVVEANGTAGGAISTLTVDQDIDTAYSGFLRDQNHVPGRLALVKTGSGLLDLSAAQTASTYSGGLTVNEGTIGFANATNIGSGAITLGGGTLRYTPPGTTALTIPNAAISLTTGTESTIEVTDAGGTLTSSGIISGLGDLIKTGEGTLILSNANTYDGQTTVSEGVLLVNGNQSGANGAIFVSADATLGGSGTLGSSSISGAGRITAGLAGAPGTLSFAGDLSTTGVTWLVDLVHQTSVDFINVSSGALDITGSTLQLATSGAFSASDPTVYRIAQFGTGGGQGLTGVFLDGMSANLDEGAIINGQYRISYGGVQTGFITLSAIPEPSTVTLLLVFLSGAFAIGRFRNRRSEAALPAE